MTATGPHVLERRIYATEFRDVKGSTRQKWATAVTYNTVDDYKTIWNPGVFDKALSQRMPTVLYGHDWHTLEHVLGKGIDTRQTPPTDGPPGVDVLIEFDDPDFVPMARQAMWQVANKTLRDVSVGFERREWVKGTDLPEADRERGAMERMMEAGMDELSIVLRGAVTGAQVRGRRSVRVGSGAVDLDALVEIARRKSAGDLSDAEANAAIELLSQGSHEIGTGAAAVEGDGSGEVPSPDAVLEANIDAALASVE